MSIKLKYNISCCTKKHFKQLTYKHCNPLTTVTIVFLYSRIHKHNKVTTQIIILFEIKYGWKALFIFLADFLKIVLG